MSKVRGSNPAGRRETASGRGLLRRPLLISAVGHVSLVAAGLIGVLTAQNGMVWGVSSTGGAAMVQLVSAASVPLPAPRIATKNNVATEDPALHSPEPPKPAATKKPDTPEQTVDLPARNAKVVPKKAAPKTAKPEAPKEAAARKEPPRRRQVARLRKPPPETPPGNEIPLGQGGPVQGPYGIFQTDAGSGGFGFTESAGNFAERYGWYVTAIRNRISSNWLKGTVNPNIRVAPRVYVTFQILRDGQLVNTQLTASSGLASLDRSALRAVYDSSPMPPLPADYLAPSVAVEFWFDFRR